MRLLFRREPEFVFFGRELNGRSYDSRLANSTNRYDEIIETTAGVNLISFDSLNKLILQGLDDLTYVREIQQHSFRVLLIWISWGDKEIRMEQAKSLIKHFTFTVMEPTFIVECVDASNLLNDREMREIYRSTWLREIAHRHGGGSRPLRRRGSFEFAMKGNYLRPL